jgi:hypothetical protein
LKFKNLTVEDQFKKGNHHGEVGTAA